MSWIAGGCRQADAPGRPLGTAAAEFFPGNATIDRAEDSARSAAALKHPGMALHGPQAGEQDQRIIGVHDQRANASGVIYKQGLLPALAAISSAEDAAIGVRPPYVS